jgi:hypothetical protein
MAGKPAYHFTPDALLTALRDAGGVKLYAARALGCTEMTFSRHLRAAFPEGVPGEIHVNAPPGHVVSGVSTLVKTPDGGLQWVKTRAPADAAAVIDALRKSMGKIPAVPRIVAPKKGPADLLAVYCMGDPHVGMYAWGEEAGEDFDLEIAERIMLGAAAGLVEAMPPAKEALIVNLGDFFHADTLDAITLRSKNHLDVDTRWNKVLRVGVRIMRQIIETALTRHQSVRVINEIGNHDEHTSQMLTVALSMAYEKNPRVNFDESPAKFHYHRFGRCLIGVTHGDFVKPEALGGIMSADRAQDWGETAHRYWYTGHVHHKRLYELPGCTVESFRTLAAKDAWHAASGYRSGRDMQGIVLHRDAGEVERHTINAVSALARSAA